MDVRFGTASVMVGAAMGCGWRGSRADVGLPPAPLPVDLAQGVAAAEPGPDWIEALIPEVIGWEEMPGTTAPENPERPGQLRAFFVAHPEYRDPVLQERLAEFACGFGVEDGHRRLVEATPPAALVVEVERDDWRVAVAHTDSWCTSDDWSWFTEEVSRAVRPQGITWAYADAGHDRVVVRREGRELARHPLGATGYWLGAAGRAPTEVPHDLVDGVLAATSTYFGSAVPGEPGLPPTSP